jgi:hypothetical protein
MNDESSEARNSTAPAISSGSPKRPIGTCTRRVDPDTLAGELHPELAGHRQDAALGRRVGDLAGRRAHHGHERRGVDDRAAPLLEHVGQRGLAAQVDRREVDLLHPPPRIELGVEDRVVVRWADPGVVEGDVHRAEGVLRRPEERVHLLLVRDVDVHVRRVVGATELLDDPGSALVVDVADHDLRALGGEPAHRRQPDPGATSGDDGHPSLDASCHMSALLRCVRVATGLDDVSGR